MGKHGPRYMAPHPDQGWYWALGQLPNDAARVEIVRQFDELRGKIAQQETELKRYRQAAQWMADPGVDAYDPREDDN
jgi:hypothetical protein